MTARRGGPIKGHPTTDKLDYDKVDGLDGKQLLDGGWEYISRHDGKPLLEQYDSGRFIRVCFDYCRYRFYNRNPEYCRDIGNSVALMSDLSVIGRYPPPRQFDAARKGFDYLKGGGRWKMQEGDVLIIGNYLRDPVLHFGGPGHAMYFNGQSIDHMIMCKAGPLINAPIPLRMVLEMEARARRGDFQFTSDTGLSEVMPNLRNFQSLDDLIIMINNSPGNLMICPMQLWSKFKDADPIPDPPDLTGYWESGPPPPPESPRHVLDLKSQGSVVPGQWGYTGLWDYSGSPGNYGGLGCQLVWKEAHWFLQGQISLEQSGGARQEISLTLVDGQLVGSIGWPNTNGTAVRLRRGSGR